MDPATSRSPLARRDAIRVASRAVGSIALVFVGACVFYGIAADGYEAVAAITERMSLAVTFGVLASLRLTLRHRAGQRGRSAVVASLATLFMVLPLLAVGASESVGASILPTLARPFDCALGPFFFTPALMTFVALPVLLAALGRHVRIDLWLRAGALAALVVVGLGVALTFRHLSDPDPVSYLPSLPVIGDVSPGETLALGDGTSLDYRLDHDGHGESPSRCHIENLADTDGAPFFTLCTRLRVRRDAAAGHWILVSTFWSTPDGYGMSVLRAGERRLRAHLYAADLHGGLAPPVAWVVGGYIGLALGLFFFVRAVRCAKDVPSRERCREGVLGEDGWVSFPDTPPIELSPVHVPTLAQGPVTVEIADVATASYRSAASGTVVRAYAGTFASVDEAARSQAPGLYALGLVSSLLCSAPLLTWWLSWPQRVW